jgi:hypothetical protein
MKNHYLIIIALACISNATAQSISVHSQTELVRTPAVDETSGYSEGHNPRISDFTHQSGYNGIILYGYNILWVFNDVGNISTRRNGNNMHPGNESSNSLATEISVFPLPAKDHLNFTFSTEINSGTIMISDAAGKLMLTEKFSGNKAILSSSDFMPGIYYYQVLGNNKFIGSGKFIRE